MRTLRDFNLKGKRVLIRCDFNVPLSQKGEILDDFRIRETIPTLEYLIERGAKIILMSHLGRPEGREEEKYSLKPIAPRLEKLVRKPVHPVKSDKVGAKQFNRVKFLPDCVGPEVEKEIEKMKEKDIVLLENLRFYKEEMENNENFARDLAKLGDIYINEAFSVCHRFQASVVGITKFLPSGAGFLLKKEIKILSQIVKNPKRPLVVIIGGSKVKDKAKVTERFSEIADFLLLGNLVAKEIREKEMKIKYPQKFFFPVNDKDSFDIGEKTIDIFKGKILKAKTIFWAGPLGKIEEEKYQKGTKEIAQSIIESGAFSVIGGGDTIEFINKIGLIEKFGHVSTGGGAMLEFLAGEKLAGIAALRSAIKVFRYR